MEMETEEGNRGGWGGGVNRVNVCTPLWHDTVEPDVSFHVPLFISASFPLSSSPPPFLVSVQNERVNISE